MGGPEGTRGAPGEAPALRAENLVKRFGTKRKPGTLALSGVTLEVPKSGITALAGPDGAGKTTFLRLAAGLLGPTSGTLEVLGIDESRDPQSIQDRISYMPQKFGLYEDLSVYENLELYSDLHGVPRAEREKRYPRLLGMAGLSEFTARPAGKLSGGMKQKLGVICTLVRTPGLLLLDEPSVGVDPLSRRDLWEIVRGIADTEGVPVLWATSYLDEAAMADRCFVLHGGRVLAGGVPSDFPKKVRGETFYAEPLPGEPARLLQARFHDRPDIVVDAVPEGGRVRVIARPGADPGALRAIVPGRKFSAREPDFEDAFMQLVTGDRPVPAQEAAAAPEALGEKADEGAEPVIRVRNLVRRFGTFTAVANTSFDVSRGEIFGLLGPNGAGKTTTFRMLCGLLPPTSGDLSVAGKDLRVSGPEARDRIGYVAQKFSLYRDLTARENLEFFGGAYGLLPDEHEARIEAALRDFGLDPDAVSGSMPEGFRKKLAIAAALLHRPAILFLDEPTSGLDPAERRGFWRRVTGYAADGVTVIVTTHFMEEAEYCDRIAIQASGRFLALGTPDEVRREAGGARDMNDAFIRIVERSREERK